MADPSFARRPSEGVHLAGDRSAHDGAGLADAGPLENVTRRAGAETLATPVYGDMACGEPRSSLSSSFCHAFAGLCYVVKTQRNMRIHLAIAAIVLVLGLYLHLDWTEWAVLGLTIGFVLVAEMFNTVAEAALDAATPYYHPLVKIAKDVAAGAVLVCAVISVGVGLLILGPPLWSTFTAWLGF